MSSDARSLPNGPGHTLSAPRSSKGHSSRGAKGAAIPAGSWLPLLLPSNSKFAKFRRRAAQRGVSDRVDAFPGGNDHGVIRPAELVIFTPGVPDTLILNQLP